MTAMCCNPDHREAEVAGHLGLGVLLMRPLGDGSSSTGRPARPASPRFSSIASWSQALIKWT